MKKLLYIFLFFSGVIAMQSCQDDLDIAALSDFPPSFVSLSPADGGKVVVGGFDIRAVVADGTTSPLTGADVRLLDASENELNSFNVTLSGVLDSIVIEGSTFDAANLPVASYFIEWTIRDASGQETTRKTGFEISTLPFAAVENEMFLAGSYNGWGADAFTLVADYTWQLTEITMDGGEWKLKNCADWCDKDWSDPDCLGTVTESTGGGANSACSPVGLVNFTYNDLTGRYTIEPAVTFAKNVDELYLLGTFNDFDGGDYPFALTADNMWVSGEIELAGTDKFKFSEGTAFMGTSFGDSDMDGVADEFGSPIEVSSIAGYVGDAFYTMTFNDATLEYALNFVRFPSIGIIGSATPGGWDTDTDMMDNGDGTFSILISLLDGEAKFRANDSWDQNWGGTDFPNGVGTLNGPNIPVTAGFYNVVFNPATGDYRFEESYDVGIIGSATSGGWDTDTDMINNGDGTYSLIIGLIDGEVKFRANDDWPINWGSTDFPSGIGAMGGDNIPVSAGIYEVSFNAGTGEYNFTELSIGIIGSATPGGWDTDTDMPVDGITPGVVSVTMELVEGEVKFRANDDWPINWGGSDFPTGVAERDAGNIFVTAGNYTITFNLNTREYAFN